MLKPRAPIQRTSAGPGPGWINHEPNPSCDRWSELRLFAVLGTWMEADIVEATVRNARRQGVERVFLVDNASPDATVERAVAAGAELARTFSTDVYDEALRMRQMNDVVRDVSAASAVPIWWLWLDADEFHNGPNGMTVFEYVASLDRRFRIVGARMLNHFPTGEPHYTPGRHPIDDQPMASEYPAPTTCALAHRKHPLQLFVPGEPPITSGPGFHTARCATRPLLEPPDAIWLHHFPFRRREDTMRRLEALCDSAEPRAREEVIGPHHIGARRRAADAVYEGRWDDVDLRAHHADSITLELMHWQQITSESSVPRWYEEAVR